MIEPTDEMYDAFMEGGDIFIEDGNVKDGLAAVIPLVERELSAGWLIWSNEHQMWWKADRAGYTTDMMCAGRYDLDAALAQTGRRKTVSGLPGEVVVRAPSVALIGHRDLAGIMRAATAEATRQAMTP